MCTLLLRKKHRRRPHILQNGISLLQYATVQNLLLLVHATFQVHSCATVSNRVQVMAPYLTRCYIFGLNNYLWPLQVYLNSADRSASIEFQISFLL